jgi:hypothetical protein
MLWGFPGDKTDYYEETLNILPLIRHLDPPAVFRHLCLDRFCKYFEKPGNFQIDALRPWTVYKMVYPDWAAVDKLAYRFTGDYPCESYDNPGLIQEIANEIESWRKFWKKSKLFMIAFADYFAIYDNRNITEKNKNYILDVSQAKVIMTYCIYNESEYQKWAVTEKLGVVVDSWYVPLVTTSPELLLQLEE